MKTESFRSRFMRTILCDPAVLQHQNSIAEASGSQTVGDENAGPSPGHRMVLLINAVLCDRIQCSGRFIQDKDRSVPV